MGVSYLVGEGVQSARGVCNQWTGLDWTELDWTELTFCTNCNHDHVTISCVIVYCVCCYFEDCRHI